MGASMEIILSIVLGALSIYIGNWVSFIISLLIGMLIEPTAEKHFEGFRLKKIRYIWGIVWNGITIGMINSLLSNIFELYWIILHAIFIIYVIYTSQTTREMIYYDLCEGDEDQNNKFTRLTEIITFIFYILGFYGLMTILNM